MGSDAMTGVSTTELSRLLDSSEERNIEAYWRLLSGAASGESDPERAKTLTWLSHLAAMMLEPLDQRGPFLPLWQNGETRSMLPCDLTDAQIEQMRGLATIQNHPDMLARISDTLWLKLRDRQFAELAIDGYFAVSSTHKHLSSSDRADRLFRATAISKSLGKNNSHYARAISEVRAFLDDLVTSGDLWVASAVTQFAADEKLLPLPELRVSLEQCISGSTNSDSHVTRNAYLVLANINNRLNDVEARKAAIAQAAETHICEAGGIPRETSIDPMSRAFALEKAFQMYRSIPKWRNDETVALRIQEVHSCYLLARESTPDLMQAIQVPPIDLRKYVQFSVDHVQRESLRESVLALAQLFRVTNFVSIKQSASETVKGSILRTLFPATIVSHDGRVVAMEAIAETSMGIDDTAVWAQMVEHSQYHRQVVVAGAIEPARLWILEHHHVSESSLLWLLGQNSVVPSYRAQTWVKGIVAGFRADFITSTALLVPQIEHLLRDRLKLRAVATTGIDKDGIENELTLDSLIDLSLEHQTIDENYAFDLRSLLVDRLGSNLRNQHCHGLLSDHEYHSPDMAYFWAFALNMLCYPILRIRTESQMQSVNE